MFTYSTFTVDIVRGVDVSALRWLERGEAAQDTGLGVNREYEDLRRLSWTEAKRVFTLEGMLITRIENASDTDEESALIESELCESDEHLFGLDLGVASTTVCLSAARCVPFASCNAGAFGGSHHEAYPLVAFFAKPPMVDLLLSAATEANVGLENAEDGSVVAYAGDIRNMRTFAEVLMSKSSLFNAVRLGTRAHTNRRKANDSGEVESDQYPLRFD